MGGEPVNELEILVNGEPRRVPGPATAADLLRHLGLDPRSVVVELNRRIVRRLQLNDTALADGDAVELVHFVGGG
jgi:thiamine biosynthesis protein ThiS